MSGLGSSLWQKVCSSFLIGSTLIAQLTWSQPAPAQTGAYCRLDPKESAEKENLRQAVIRGESGAQARYQAILNEHAQILNRCRDRVWPKTQAIWLRLYPCDTRPGVLDGVLDHIVNKGYNEIYVEFFYDSQVLIPQAENNTPWLSVVRSPGYEKVDLLADAIKKGRERGLKVYAWLFSMNFGYAYAVRPDRTATLARNGKGENTLSFVPDGSQAFIDPYNRQAQLDYFQLVQAALRRRPDGVLFDYIRYPRGSGSDSVATRVQDLWIYGEASRQALLDRALNNPGRELIARYLDQGGVSNADIQAARSRYPGEGSPTWQGGGSLWDLAVAHAAQGVIDYLNFASTPVLRQGIPAGAVFFPGGNKPVGAQGYDSRLQPWDRFSPNLEWHPMSYALCGNASCIVEEILRVVDRASPQTKIIPALAGQWGQSEDQRPSLDIQMQAIRQYVPKINAVSHFAYSWQEREIDRQRRFCEL